MPAAASSTHSNSAAARPRAFGRFELRQLLGKSAGAMVWLAWDPRAAQELMLTMPRARPADAVSLEHWQREVRMAARLNHPNLAPVTEVGSHDGWPFATVDRRLGVTLTEWLAAHEHPSPAESTPWFCQALTGLAFAHEANMAHGDVQLHSLVIGDSGAVRVMALATAGAVESPRASPLHSADLGRLHAQRALGERDVLACGVLMHQVLSGQAALDDDDAASVISRMPPFGHEIVRLPWSTPQPIPEGLRAIVNRATATQERQRYLNARTLLRALDGWIAAQATDGGGPLALLLDRLRSVGHLPALRGVGTRVATLAGAQGQRTDEIAEQILQDMALSFEMLRQANSASVQGTQVGGTGPVLTVRRAVALLGIDGIRNASVALRTWPGPLNDTHAAAMQRSFDRVRLAGHAAQMLRPRGYDPEVIYLVAVLQNLGRLLVQYHFPEEAEQIWQLMRPATPVAPPGPAPAESPQPQPGMSEAAASYAVLGVDIETIGTAVVRHWGLGDEMQHMIHRLPHERHPPAVQSDADMLLTAASCANDAVDAITLLPAQKQGAALGAIAQRYARSLGVTVADVVEALKAARSALSSGSLVAGDRSRDE